MRCVALVGCAALKRGPDGGTDMRIRQLFGVILLLAAIDAAFSESAQAAITMQRVIVPAVYTPGQIINVTVTINHTDANNILALGIKDTVPGSWRLASETPYFSANPDMKPAAAQDIDNLDGTRNFEFAYILIPPFPATFTYRAQTDTSDSGSLTITGHAVYRQTGSELQSPVVETVVQANSSTEGEPATGGGCTGCSGCSQGAKGLGVTLGDFFVSALALATLLALSRRRG